MKKIFRFAALHTAMPKTKDYFEHLLPMGAFRRLKSTFPCRADVLGALNDNARFETTCLPKVLAKDMFERNPVFTKNAYGRMIMYGF